MLVNKPKQGFGMRSEICAVINNGEVEHWFEEPEFQQFFR